MGLFFPDDKELNLPVRKTGFPRYREILEENYKIFFLVGFITLIFFIPFAAGMVYAVLPDIRRLQRSFPGWTW